MAYRYLGNKARLVDWLVDIISSGAPANSSIADPMCGTAAVSEALASAGYRVQASDELTFPILHAKVRLLMASEPPFRMLGGYAKALFALNQVNPAGSYFHREYSADGQPTNGCRARAYFTGANASKIDAMRALLLHWEVTQSVTDLESSLLRHDLIMAVNDVANIAGTYGYYRSTWNNQALNPIILRPTLFRSVGDGHSVRQGKVEHLAESLEVTSCYLDPPYTKRQYAGNYHLLETLARGDEPEPVGDGGLRDWYDNYSDFCSKRFVSAAFTEVVKRLDCEHIFVSYSEDGLLPANELQEILNDRGEVTRHVYPLQRYRSNNAGKSGQLSEYLFHLRVS